MLQRGGGPSLYAGHVSTSRFEKLLITSSAALRALADPRRADLVGVVGEASGEHALRAMHTRMHAHPIGRSILQDRPLISKATMPLHALRSMPHGSLGAEYARFLERHQFDPDERSDVRFVDDADLAYVMLRYRQVHDLWHVLFALPPTFMGEVALKWLEAAQTGLPMCSVGAFAAGVRLRGHQRSFMVRHVLPWAMRHAASGVDLLSVYYERELERDLDELRAELELELSPLQVL